MGRTSRNLIEVIKRCRTNPSVFIQHFCQIQDSVSSSWLPFKLWKAQKECLTTFQNNKRVIVLKARQLGLTWLALAYALWVLLFRPNSTVLLFSMRDDEAKDMLRRLYGMFQRLPVYLQEQVITHDRHNLTLRNGSRVSAFPTRAGDSYSANLAVIDEADLIPDLDGQLESVKPTIDMGGQLLLLSRADKSQPNSTFKRIYKAAVAGRNGYAGVFLPWDARPDRSQEWYEDQRRDSLARTGTLDALFAQYPASDAEALLPRELDKRISPVWLARCYEPLDAVVSGRVPSVPGLVVYRLPGDGRFVVGADPAEGNPSSDDSCAVVLDCFGWQVAELVGKFEPAVFGGYLLQLCEFFNRAPVLVERNNHGHAVLLWLRDNAPRVRRLVGYDGKCGWLSNSKGKSLLYAELADVVRTQSVTIRSLETYHQVAGIEAGSLCAPRGECDDRADALALAVMGLAKLPSQPTVGQPVVIRQGRDCALFAAPSKSDLDGLRVELDRRKSLFSS